MFNQLYVKILDLIKKYHLTVISFFIMLIIFAVPLPYFINTPGGLSDLSSKVLIEGYSVEKNRFNLTYVNEYRATIPLYLISLFNENWEVYKRNEVVADNETIKEAHLRDIMLLNEANQSATIVAYKAAGKNINITDERIFVTYINEMANTNLKVNDEIIMIDNININNVKEIKSYINTLSNGTKINIKIKRNNELLDKEATIFEYEGELLIGILLSNIFDIETEPPIKFNFAKNESGPSGGVMMSLAIYDTLTSKNLKEDFKIAGTGTIDSDGNVGQIGGARFKILTAAKNKADIFLVPNGKNYEEALKVKKENNLKIDLVPINHFEDVINYLYK